MRRWSSSLIMTEKVWSLLMTTPPPCSEPLNSRLIRWRSTRICFSRSVRSLTPTLRLRFMEAAEARASRQSSRISCRWGGRAQPGNGLPARLRARRIRVIRTIAVLLLATSVSSEGVAIREAMFMASGRRLRRRRLLHLVDLVAVPRRLLVALALDRVGEFRLELGHPLVKRLAVHRSLGNLAGVLRALVHAVEPLLDGMHK